MPFSRRDFSSSDKSGGTAIEFHISSLPLLSTIYARISPSQRRMRYFSFFAFSPVLGEMLLSAFLTSSTRGFLSGSETLFRLLPVFINERVKMVIVLIHTTALSIINLLEVFILITNDIFSNTVKNIHMRIIFIRKIFI